MALCPTLVACILAASPRPQASLTSPCIAGEVSPACPFHANNDVVADDVFDDVDSYVSEADIPAPTAKTAAPPVVQPENLQPAPAVASGTAYSDACTHYSVADGSSVDNAWCELNCPAKNCPAALCQCKMNTKEAKHVVDEGSQDGQAPVVADATPKAPLTQQDKDQAARKAQHARDQAQRNKDRNALRRQKEQRKEEREQAKNPLSPPQPLSSAAIAAAEAAEAAAAAAAHVVKKQARRAAEAGRHSNKYRKKDCDMDCRQEERRTLKNGQRVGSIAEKEKQRSFNDDAKREAEATNSAAKAAAKEAKRMAAAVREDTKAHHRDGTKHFPKREGFGGQPAQPVWPLQ